MTQEERDEFREEMLRDQYEEELNQRQLFEDPLEFILNKYADELQQAYDLMTPIVNELFEHGITMTHSDLIKEI